MLSKILFPVDFSPFTDKMMECAGESAAAGMKETVLLHVIDSKPCADYGDFVSPAIFKNRGQRRKDWESSRWG